MLILLFLCIGGQLNSQGFKSYSRNFPIRVLIGSATDDVIYQVTTPVFVYCSGEKTALVKKNNIIKIHASGRNFELYIRDKVFSANSFRFEPADSAALLQYAGREYEGSLQFHRTDSRILVVNIVPFEKYINGVVAAELGRPDSAGMESALEAQAICARSFTLMKLGEMKSIYDLESTTQSQVYYGRGLYPAVQAAVENTIGQIITYNDEPAVVFYHSCCGGLTENAENAFSTSPLPYLTSGIDGEPAYCSQSPVYSWKEEYSLEEICGFLKNAGLLKTRFNEPLLTVEITKRYPSGRAQEIAFNFTDGTTALVTAPNIRNILRRQSGGGVLRSAFISIKLMTNDANSQKIIIEGRGNGHGVGLCQWGAFAMSKRGISTKDILLHYFPGTGTRNIYDR